GKLKALSKPLREKIGGTFGKSNKPNRSGNKADFDPNKHKLNKAQLQKLNDDLADNKALKDAMDGVNGNPALVDAWKKLDDIGADEALRKNPGFLKHTNDWDGGGATLSKNTDGNLNLADASGNKIAEVKNGKVLPEKYGEGSPIGEPKNGYQLVNDAGELKMKRTPDVSSYNADDLAKLKNHPDAHALERHGHDVTDDALKKRAEKGIAPDGVNTGSPNYSSRFNSPEMVQEALENVKQGTPAFNAKLQDTSTGFWIVEHPGNFGVGFSRNVNAGLIRMNKVTAIYDEVTPGNFQLVTMYPNK
ncbi:MAG: hypothetical protein ACJAWV_003627, partial [Flammeovirgaceae bacterium]